MVLYRWTDEVDKVAQQAKLSHEYVYSSYMTLIDSAWSMVGG